MTDQDAKTETLRALEHTSVVYGMKNTDWRFRHRRRGIPEQFHYPEVNNPNADVGLPEADRLEAFMAAHPDAPVMIITGAHRVVNPNYYGRVTITA